MEDNMLDNILKRKLEKELYHECKKVRKTVETNNYELCDVKGEYSKKESGLLKSFLSKDAVHQFRSGLINEHIHKSTNDGKRKYAFLQREGMMAHCSLPDTKLQDIKCASYTPSSIFNNSGSKVNKLNLIFKLPAKVNNYSHSVETTAAGFTSMAHHISTMSQKSGNLGEKGKACFIFDKNMDYENRRVLKNLHLDPDVGYSLGGMLPPLVEKVEEENETSQDDTLKRKQLSTDQEIVEYDRLLICKSNFPLNAILFKLPTLVERLLSFRGDILVCNGRVVICMSNDTILDDGDHSLKSASTYKRNEQSLHANNIEVNGWNKTDGSSLEITEITSNESEVEVDENGNYLTTCLNGDVHTEALNEDTIDGMHDDKSYDCGKFTEHCEHVVATKSGVMDIAEENTLCSKMKSLHLGSKVPSKASMKENVFRKLWEAKTCNKRNNLTSNRTESDDQVTANITSDSIPAKESVSEVKSNLENMLFPFEDTDVKNGIVSSLKSWEERFQNLEQYMEHGKSENVLEEKDGMNAENALDFFHYFASPNDNKSLAEEINTEESLMEDKNSSYRNDDEDINGDDHMVPSTNYASSSCDYYQYNCQSFKPIRVGLSRKSKVAASLHPYLNNRKKLI